MRKWDGLISYVKGKLRTATYAAAVVSGLSIAIAKEKMTAAAPDVVVKWMEDNRRRMILNMWGISSEAWEQMRLGFGIDTDPEQVKEALKKREAERKVEEEGRAECAYCRQELIKNENLGVWESETLLAYCTDARDHKHRPKIVWKEEEND